MNSLRFMFLQVLTDGALGSNPVGVSPTLLLGISLGQFWAIFISTFGVFIIGYRRLGRAYRRRKFRASLATVLDLRAQGSKKNFSTRGVGL